MKSPSLDRVISFLRERLRENPSERLPSIRQISARCSVSARTVSKAIKQLCSEGEIVIRWGAGCFPSGYVELLQKDEAGSQERRKSKSEISFDQIRNDLINFRFPPGSCLPSFKELSFRYGVCYPTLRTAVNKLCSEGVLLKKSGHYYVREKKVSREWRLKVVVICAAYNGSLIIEKERERDFFRHLTIETSQRGLDLEFFGYVDRTSAPHFIDPGSHNPVAFGNRNDIVGYILVTWHMKDYVECLNRIRHLGKPVSIWVEHFRSIPKISISNISTPAFFDLSYSRRPGAEMGRLLIEYGHRRIAYISPFHDSVWSAQRLCGLEEAFKDAGLEGGVVPFVLNDYSNDWSFMDIVLKEVKLDGILDEKELAASSELRDFEKIEQIRSGIYSIFRDGLIMRDCKSLLDRALSDRNITAWVAANDLCALLFLDYLKEKSIRVPDDLSLAGFDNTFESLEHGLTSYDFNIAGLVHSMIEHLLNPSGLISVNKGDAIHLEGKVIRRKSTRRISWPGIEGLHEA
ncbi:MAG: GntR family transcriptional regulator [Fibrobacter sp.]|nr:GntR family transcriptional regulator [Fibrobacter sp.]